MFAKDSAECTDNAFGSSVFQQVPTFARENRLCIVHNLFNYRNITNDAPVEATRPSIRSIAARIALFIPDAFSWLWIADGHAPPGAQTRNALKMDAHPCDRDYEHTEYKMCMHAFLAVCYYGFRLQT
jgi:hypothetical protein